MFLFNASQCYVIRTLPALFSGHILLPNKNILKAASNYIFFTPTQASTDFWNGRDQWLPTWHLDVNKGEGAALQVDYVKVWAI